MENKEYTQLIESDNCIIETNIGINADPTGYGKTISMIGLIVRDKMKWDIDTPFVQEIILSEAGGRIKHRRLFRYTKYDCTLILMSQSILGQWKKELLNTSLRVATIITRKEVDLVDPNEYDVILVTPTMYNQLIMSHSSYAWKRFIFDEPGHVRVSGMKDIQAGFYWFVTATPNLIISQHKNCRNSFMKDIIGNGFCDIETQFEKMIIRNNLDFVKSSFEMPPTNYYYYDCYQPVFNLINGFVNSTISNMIEAGNIEGAITALGGTKTESLISLIERKKLEELEEIESKIRIYTIRTDETKIKEWTEKKAELVSQIDELKRRFEEKLQSTCNICLEKISKPILEPECQNLFCGECILTWLQKSDSCPLCRSKINSTELVYVKNIETNFICSPIIKNRVLTKLECIIDIISNKKNGKFLIFSSYDISFIPICNVLEENNITYTQMKGSLFSRQKSLESFKNGNTSVIFLNSSFDGAGLNLQEATDIILYHEMTNNTQQQILGRANRIGRTISLNVHYLQVKI
jgi:SNF2 family DNA or RNA helicase